MHQCSAKANVWLIVVRFVIISCGVAIVRGARRSSASSHNASRSALVPPVLASSPAAEPVDGRERLALDHVTEPPTVLFSFQPTQHPKSLAFLPVQRIAKVR
jgi:hypothetical protein